MSSRTMTVDDPVLRIPASAATLNGFREWYLSDEVPEQFKITYIAGDLYIELPGTIEPGMIEIPATAMASLNGFRAWATSDDFPERGRISFVDHDIWIDMSPEELETHNKVKSEIGFKIYRLCRRLKLGTFYGDRTLISTPRGGVSGEPDSAFVSWEALKSGRVRMTRRKDRPDEYTELVGPPDWVLEIVSRHSVTKDTRTLRKNYHRAGIPEYWLVNALGKRIDFQILVHRPRGYVAVRPKDGWVHSNVFGRSFRLVRKRDPLGLWEYTLRVKAD